MNRLTTNYKGNILKNIHTISFSGHYPTVLRSFVSVVEKEQIDIHEDIILSPMYIYNGDSATFIHIHHTEDNGCKCISTFNTYNSTGKVKINVKDKIVEIDGILKSYCSNVLFCKEFTFDKVSRIEITETAKVSNMDLLNERYATLIENNIFDIKNEPLISNNLQHFK